MTRHRISQYLIEILSQYQRPILDNRAPIESLGQAIPDNRSQTICREQSVHKLYHAIYNSILKDLHYLSSTKKYLTNTLYIFMVLL